MTAEQHSCIPCAQVPLHASSRLGFAQQKAKQSVRCTSPSHCDYHCLPSMPTRLPRTVDGLPSIAGKLHGAVAPLIQVLRGRGRRVRAPPPFMLWAEPFLSMEADDL